MTGADPANEEIAQRLATRGRDALVERLRNAYAQAAEVHADVLSIDGERLETIVQGAADRADGLQWRRALADLASGELGISLTDALAHPAVARAQELVGAPSYEDSLAALGRRPAGPGSRERSVNGGGSLAQPQDEPARESKPRDDPKPAPAVGLDPDAEPREEEPPWQSIAQPDALEADSEPTDHADPDPPAGEQPEPQTDEEPDARAMRPDGPGEAPQAGLDDPPEPEPEASETRQPAPQPRVPGPGAPPDLEPETIVQAPPKPHDDSPSRPEPAAGQVPFDDPDATREWTAHELADVGGHGGSFGSPAHSLPPQPTHVVPALPPETAAGGHVGIPEPEARRTGQPLSPVWEADEPGYQDEPGFDDEPYDQPGGVYAGQAEEQDRLRVTAIHLGGVANLPREGIELRLSAHGLDIMRGDDEILGRLMWSEIDSLEVPSPRVRRRRNRDRARLVVRTSQGDATFEVPGFSGDELNERVAPLVTRFGSR
jgi:hypothetical protein